MYPPVSPQTRGPGINSPRASTALAAPLQKPGGMPSVGHAILGLAAARAYAPSREVPWRTAATFLALALFPDLDVLLLRLHAHLGDAGLHRGASHALLVSAALGLAAAALGGQGRSRWAMLWAAVLTAASHPLADLFTGGGAGVMLAWPWSEARFLAPLRLLPAAPMGPRLLSARGLGVAARELLLFSPLLAWLAWARLRRPALAPARANARPTPRGRW